MTKLPVEANFGARDEGEGFMKVVTCKSFLSLCNEIYFSLRRKQITVLQAKRKVSVYFLSNEKFFSSIGGILTLRNACQSN